MADDLNRTLLAEIRNLTRDIEALEYQIAEKKKSLELLTEVQEKIKSHTSSSGGKRRSKQPISDMIMSVLKGRKKPTAPKVILENLTRQGYVGAPAVMYATLGRLVKAGKIERVGRAGYVLGD